MPYALYIHIPFCTHRCAYCDFNTYAGQEDSIPAYVRALCIEIEDVGRAAEKVGTAVEIQTVFFGGGTPSLLNPDHFESILATIRASLVLQSDAEITVEANPGTVDRQALGIFRMLGINRISFGVQSANSEELRMLERTHSFFDVIQAVPWARAAGFSNINLDLIYGLPEQSLSTWQTSLRRAVDLDPQHLSLYALTLEHGTPFGRWAAQGLLPLPDPDLAAEMYEWAADYLAGAGYIQYEISNWAKPVDSLTLNANEQPFFACRHNLQYWHSLPYLGLGAGAHGYVNGIRYSNVLRIKTYLDRLLVDRPIRLKAGWPLTAATVNQHQNTVREEMSDVMITGLRLTREGISSEAFRHRFGTDLEDVYGKEIVRLVGQDLLEWVDMTYRPELTGTTESHFGKTLRLTPRARLVANQVFIEFVD